VVQVNAGSYAQQVVVDTVGGTAGSPAIIQANGPVTIDGSNPLTSWTLCQGNVYYASINIPLPDTTYVDRQVFVGPVRCKHIADAYQNCDTLQQYEYSYDDANDRLYLNAGGGTPQEVYVSSRSAGIDILDGNYITIDGFTVLRTRGRGIRIRGSSTSVRSRSVTVRNCVSAYNFNRGIHLENTANCSVLNDTTHTNGKHGIYLLATDTCAVAYSESFNNNDPLALWGGVARIKIGDSGTSTNLTNVTVDYNSVHDNEDAGIDLAVPAISLSGATSHIGMVTMATITTQRPTRPS